MIDPKWGTFPERKTGEPLPASIKVARRDDLIHLCDKAERNSYSGASRKGLIENLEKDSPSYMHVVFLERQKKPCYRVACLVVSPFCRWFYLDVEVSEYLHLTDADVLDLKEVVRRIVANPEYRGRSSVEGDVREFLYSRSSDFPLTSRVCRSIFRDVPMAPA